MKAFSYKAEINKLNLLTKLYDPSDLLVFDIETTGFSPETSKLYMIGYAYYDGDGFTIVQLFNDDGTSEEDLLAAFSEVIVPYGKLFHYNGDGFDIPYVEKKLKDHGMPGILDDIESIDLYKLLRQFRNLLHLDNLKQKTVERFLGINRLDKYSGGDLIKVYKDYLSDRDEAKEKLLFQHNYDDLEGFLACCSMLSYARLRAGCFSVSKMQLRENHLVFSLDLEYELPRRITCNDSGITITGNGSSASIQVPIYLDELKFFFDDYKDYYYLPGEDRAVHKSIASFVDKEHREQAKKDNCYTRRKGYFISQFDGEITPGYRHNARDKESYIELVDSFLKDMNLLTAYARFIVMKLMK